MTSSASFPRSTIVSTSRSGLTWASSQTIGRTLIPFSVSRKACCAGCRLPAVGCGMAFPFRNFEVDHVIPRVKGGSDHVENLQLVCGAGNRAKGSGPQAELIAKLRDRGQLAA